MNQDRDGGSGADVKRCPFCGSLDTLLAAECSTSLMVSLYHCRSCRSPFEAIKWSTADPVPREEDR